MPLSLSLSLSLKIPLRHTRIGRSRCGVSRSTLARVCLSLVLEVASLKLRRKKKRTPITTKKGKEEEEVKEEEVKEEEEGCKERLRREFRYEARRDLRSGSR